MANRYPRSNQAERAVERLHERIVGDVRQALLVLSAAVGVVLLIACANVASLLLARGRGGSASSRSGPRSAPPADGWCGSSSPRAWCSRPPAARLGLLLGVWAVACWWRCIPDGVPRAEEIGLDARVAAVSLLVSLASALLFGLVPSLQASRADAATVLRGGGDRASTAGGAARGPARRWWSSKWR